MSAGVVAQYSATGTLLNTIQMAAGARPSALYFDASTGQLLVGDQRFRT